MSTHHNYPPLVLSPRRSYWLLGLAVVTPMVTLAVVLALPLGWLALPLALVVLLGGGWTLWAEVLRRAPSSIQDATWHPDGSWTLRLVSGRELRAQLSPATFVSPGLVSLVFVLEGSWWRGRTLALAPDSLAPETLRRLRQRLRLAGERVERA